MRVIARIKGGLGNQLFCYAAAYRLASYLGAELVLDTTSGFARDAYNRHYQLGCFDVPGRYLNFSEKLYPCSRFARLIHRRLANFTNFKERRYLEEEIKGFDSRLLEVSKKNWRYLDGYWQSENFFGDVSDDIRKLFELKGEELQSARTFLGLDELSSDQTPVMVHVRWFDSPDCSPNGHNLDSKYYKDCMERIEESAKNPVYFIFSDAPEAALRKLPLKGRDYRIGPYHHHYADADFGEFRLMQAFEHFIIANSTFSWWAAWLGETVDSLVLCPSMLCSTVTSWGLGEMLPKRWTVLDASYE